MVQWHSGFLRSPNLATQQMRYPPTLQHATTVAQKRSPRRARSTDLVNDRAAPEIIVLHAGWLDGEILVWGEMPAAEASGGDKRRGQRAGSVAAAPLPSGVPNAALAHVLVEAASGLKELRVEPALITLWLPTAGGVPLASNPVIAPAPDGSSAPTLAPWSADALRWDRGSILLLLSRCADHETLGPGLLIGEDVRYWVQSMRFAASLVTRQAFLPSVEVEGHTYVARWQPFIAGQVEPHLEQLAAAMPGGCRALSHAADEPPATAPRLILRDLVAALTDHLVREAAGGNAWPPAVPQARAPDATFDSMHDHQRGAPPSA